MSSRPKKEIVKDFLLTQYACIKSGVPGVTIDSAKSMVEYGNYFLYENEIESVAEDLAKKDPTFDAADYVQFLLDTGAVKSGNAPAFGDRGTTLNSREKALQVAANPSNEEEVNKIIELATTLVTARKEINKLLAKGVTLGIGFNSGKRSKAENSPQNSDQDKSLPDDAPDIAPA